MEYLFFFIVLVILELIYFKIADKLNIIDKPNERSSHSEITLRGGGVIFYIGALLYFFKSSFEFPYFFIGLTLMAVISFLDDVFTLSNKLRLLIHFVSILLMAYQWDLFFMPVYFLIIGFIIVVGMVNAYNFMDGINGMTAAYSLSLVGLLYWTNMHYAFVNPMFLIFIGLSVLVFGIFNFRMRAKCFAGDVGSVSIAYILLFALGLLILTSGKIIYILFLSVYGIDAVWTIIRRLILKENIFEAHRSHLYQFMANEGKINKLLVSFSYAALQFFIGYLVILFAQKDEQQQLVFSVVLLGLLSIIYLVVKKSFTKKYSHI